MRRAFLVGLAVAIPFAAKAETLADALASSYQTNPVLLRERYRLRATDEHYVQERAGYRPNVAIEATHSYEDLRYGDGLPGTRRDAGYASGVKLNVDQPLYTGGGVSWRIAAAAAAIRQGRAALRSAEGDVLFDVIQAYADVRRDMDILDIRRLHHQALEDQLREVVARRRAGETTLTDVAQAEAQRAATAALLSAAGNQLERSQTSYLAVVGHAAGTLAPMPTLPGLPANANAALSAAADDSPELASARNAEQESRARIGVARSALLPHVSVSATAGWFDPRDHIRSGEDPKRSVSVELKLTQPLYAGGRNLSAIREASNLNSSDRLSIEVARRAMTRQIADAWNLMSAARDQIVAQQAQVAAAEATLKGMQVEYRVAQRSLYDVLVAESTLREAQISLVAARHDEALAGATLLRAMGRLEMRALLTGMEQYDAALPFSRVKNRAVVPWELPLAVIDRMAAPAPMRQRPETVRSPGLLPKLVEAEPLTQPPQ